VLSPWVFNTVIQPKEREDRILGIYVDPVNSAIFGNLGTFVIDLKMTEFGVTIM